MLSQQRLLKPVRKLRKAVTTLSKSPSTEEVHELRTQTRRIEAIVHALKLDQGRHGKRLMKVTTPVRKAAGKVRDADVLTQLAASLPGGEQDYGREQSRLLEELRTRRQSGGKRLHRRGRDGRKILLRRLKHLSRYLSKRVAEMQAPGSDGESGRADPASVALAISGRLSTYARLDRTNLHPYRIEVKQLRYMLQLAESPDTRLMDDLGKTKDMIGEWHDWCELESLARELFDNSKIAAAIHAIADRKFDTALTIATDLQKKYFATLRSHRAAHSTSSHPLLITATRMSA